MTERQILVAYVTKPGSSFHIPFELEANTKTRVANFFSSSTLLFFFITLRRGESSSLLTLIFP